MDCIFLFYRIHPEHITEPVMAGESNAQTNGREFLEKKGWLVVKLSVVSKPGFPDHIAMKAGKTVFIEWKNPGKQGKGKTKVQKDGLQNYWHDKLRKAGFEVITAYSNHDLHHL